MAETLQYLQDLKYGPVTDFSYLHILQSDARQILIPFFAVTSICYKEFQINT